MAWSPHRASDSACWPQEFKETLSEPAPLRPPCRWTGFGQSLPSEQFPFHTPIADLFTHLTEAALQTVCG